MTIADLLNELSRHTVANDTPQAFTGLVNAVYAIRQYVSKENTIQDPMTKQRLKFDDLMLEYGLDKTYTSRLLSSRDKYFENNQLKDIFMFFTKWKLFYLLPVPSSVLEPAVKSGRVASSMSVKKIRKFATKYKATTTASNKEEEYELQLADLPEKFDSSKEYTFAYFDGLSRGELVNCSWEMYKEIQKLKGVNK